MTTRCVVLALGLVAGIVVATFTPHPLPALSLIAAGIAGLAASVTILRAERRWREGPVYAVVLAALLCGFPIGYFRAQQKLDPPARGSLRRVLEELPDGTQVHLRGVLCAEPEPRGPRRGDLRVRVDAFRTESDPWRTVSPGNVLVRTYVLESSAPGPVARLRQLVDPTAYGYRIEIQTRYRAPRPGLNPGEFDFPAFLRQRDLLAWFRCHVNRIEILNESRGNAFVELALETKRRFLATYKQTIRAPASRLVAAATLGARRAVEGIPYRGKDITESFRHAGVGHVLAVSGLHVSIVALLLYGLFRMAGLQPRVFAPLLIVLLLLFAVLTGARPSSVRAVIMSSAIMVLFAYFRYDFRKATAIGLAVSAIVILLRNPMVLYSPGFLLSYGAVLSLVMLVPPVDRLMCSLRGYAFLLFLAWWAVVAALAGNHLHALLDPWNWVGLIGLLGLMLQAGRRLNRAFPGAWRIGLARLPVALRYFAGAQLAIQVGMMVPLSAWFFGRFPLAGVLVNLVAIPAVGILVQLGVLTGMLGLVPVIGHSVALPFGAADSLVGEFFLLLAHTASTWFPYPATPKPGLAWMALYYAGLLVFLLAMRHRVRVQEAWYAAARFLGNRVRIRCAVAALPLVLAGVLLKNLYPGKEHLHTVTCLAAGPYPALTAVSDRRRIVTINGGDGMTGERLLFETIRHEGGAAVDTAILCGPQPHAGYEGIVALASRMRIRRALIPVLVQEEKDYLETLGDAYVLDKARQGERWAVRYRDAYAALARTALQRDIQLEVLHPGSLVRWDGFEVRRLRAPDRWPDRFVTTARTALVEMQTGGWRWLVITESLPETFESVVDEKAKYDVLVLPDLSSRASYRPLIDAIARRTRPRVVVICGSRLPRNLDVDAWAFEHGSPWILLTARDGAVKATIEPDGLVFRTWVTGRRICLPRKRAGKQARMLRAVQEN